MNPHTDTKLLLDELHKEGEAYSESINGPAVIRFISRLIDVINSGRLSPLPAPVVGGLAIKALKALKLANEINHTPDMHRESIMEAWREAWALTDAALANVSQSPGGVTDQQIQAWADRHDLPDPVDSLRAMVDDARTLHYAPTTGERG